MRSNNVQEIPSNYSAISALHLTINSSIVNPSFLYELFTASEEDGFPFVQDSIHRMVSGS